MILAGDDAANEIINSEIERAIELEAKLNGENSRSSSSSNNNNNNNTNNEQQPEPPSIEQTIIRAKFQEESFNLQYSKENNNNESRSSIVMVNKPIRKNQRKLGCLLNRV
jgi:hypothetical protein